MKNMIWGLLPMAAALMLTACSSNDIEDVAEKPATKTIPFTAKVSTENATRLGAEEGSGTYTLKFTNTDKVHVYNTTGSTILEGFLDIDLADAGKTTATFTGNLTYTPGSSDPSTPADDLEICVTLVQEGGDPYNQDICSNVIEAIQKYSLLENIITYSQLSSFSFKQYTGVVDFDITLSGTNAPAVGTDVNIAVDGSSVFSDDPSNPYEFSYTSTATVTSDGKVKFAIPVDASTDDYTATLKDASVTISNASYQGTCSFADATGFEVGPKVYRAARTINTWAPTLAAAFVAGKETVLAFTSSYGDLTLSATYNGSEFSAVTPSGTGKSMLTTSSMAKEGDNLVITVVTVLGSGYMTIDTVNNTFTWSNATVGAMITLSSITIGGSSVTPLPTVAP